MVRVKTKLTPAVARWYMRARFTLVSPTSLNKAMQLNLCCLAMHLLMYTGLPALLLSRHNPFGELVVAVSIASLFGLWLLLDFMIPVYVEAKIGHYRNITRPTGWLLALNVLALGGIASSFA